MRVEHDESFSPTEPVSKAWPLARAMLEQDGDFWKARGNILPPVKIQK